MTLALVLALVAPLSTPGMAGPTQGTAAEATPLRGFEIPRLSWPPSPSPAPTVQVRARKMRAREPEAVRPTATCTMRVVPADPEIDPKIGREAPREVDSGMITTGRCAAALPPGLP
jgi:hypothetical protein